MLGTNAERIQVWRMVAGLALVALLGACGVEGAEITAEGPASDGVTTDLTSDDVATDEVEPPPTTEGPPTTEDATTTTAAEPTTTTTPKRVNPTFGETFTWDDGLAVTVAAPVAFTPSEYAATEDAAAYLAFQITVVNGSDVNVDLTLFTTTLQSGNTEGSMVFDSEQGFEGSPSTPLLPGREAVFKIGYGVSDPNDLVLEVSPDFDFEREPVIYAS